VLLRQVRALPPPFAIHTLVKYFQIPVPAWFAAVFPHFACRFRPPSVSQ
jgi:hypothetical protein